MQESTIEFSNINLTCPITCQIMEDPVVAADGHTYERAAIEAWLKNNITSPLTNLEMPSKVLTSNFLVKSLIADYKGEKKKRLELLKSSKRCFLMYSEILSTQKDALEKFLTQYKLERNIETAEDGWNDRDDFKKYELLMELKLEDAVYTYFTLEFKQYLSVVTQQHRHSLEDANGKYPSNEKFWLMSSQLHSQWIDNFLKSA